MRPKCHFNHTGKPTTLPGTEADQKRAALVRHRDEAEGAYQTPGANGYPKPEPEPWVEQPTVPRHDEWQVLSERFGQLGQQLGRANNRIKSLTKPD